MNSEVLKMLRISILVGAILIGCAAAGFYCWQTMSRTVRTSLETAIIPDDPDEVILFSIDGTQEPEERDTPPGQELLYESPILGRVIITDPSQRELVLTLVKQDLQKGWPVEPKCFYPRHVLRVVKGESTVDIVICFQCHKYELHRNESSQPERTSTFGERSMTLLRRILMDAGVPTAP